VHAFPSSSGMSPTLLQDATVLRVASLRNASAAQVLLSWAWAQRVPAAVRSSNIEHMRANAEAPFVQVRANFAPFLQRAR